MGDDMRPEEAAWIGARLAKYEPTVLSPMLELGAATAYFRTVMKPHIDREVHAPLRSRGVTILHSDIQTGDGVDICGDATHPETQERLRAVGAHCVLCCNMMEHVEDPAELARLCDHILAPGGIMIVTVPYSYPFHLDPIDTYFRPSPDQLVELFPGYKVIASEAVEAGSYTKEIQEAGNLPVEIAKAAAKLVVPLGGYQKWKSRVHKFMWLTRPYVVSCAVLRKPEPRPADNAALH